MANSLFEARYGFKTGNTILYSGNSDVVVGGELIVTGNLQLNSNDIHSSTGNIAISLNNKDVTVRGNLTVQGVTQTVGTQDYTISDSLLNLHTLSNLAPLTSDDGRDIGVRMNYYKSSNKYAFVGWSNTTGFLEYYDDATLSGGIFSGTLGTIKAAGFYANSGLFYNGTSNIAIHNAGNILFSPNATANVLVLTATGANISGTANITGDSFFGSNVTINGDLTVNGSTTTISTTNLDVKDLNITIAKGAISAAAANGAGLTVDGANATWIYNSTSNTWVSNIGANISGTLNVSGNANIGNIGTGTVIATTGNITTINGSLFQNGNSNVTVTANSNVSVFVAGNATARAVFTSTGANIAGTANVTGNANVGNLGTATAIITTGNITTINSGLMQNGNSNVTITANANVSVFVTGNATARAVFTSTGANIAGTLNATGNANVGNLGTATAIITTGNITTINSGLMQNGNSNVTINANGNVDISVAGTTDVVVVTSTGANIAGTLNATGNANVGNLSTAQVLASANVTTPQLISNVATGTAPLIVTSTTRVANLNVANSGYADTAGSATSATSATTAGTVTTAAQPNITSVGTLSSLTVTANTSTGNLSTTGANGSVTANTHVASGARTGNGNVSTVQSTFGGFRAVAATYTENSAAASATIANVAVHALDTPTIAAANLTVTMTNAATFFIQNAPTAGTNATLTNRYALMVGAGASAFGGNVVPTADNSYSLGLSGARWSTIYGVTLSGTASSAQYADLAERYDAGVYIEPGTVVEFGGDYEVQICGTHMSTKIAGVVSTNPGYLMNNTEDKGDNWVAVALQGRVPTKVVGPVAKGDMMVSAGNGHAMSCAAPIVGSVIGKALENFEGAQGVIEVVVGRL